jgi:hypothetical protein
MYQLREGGSDNSKQLTQELLNNVWPEDSPPFTAIAEEEDEHDDASSLGMSSSSSACQGIMCMNNGSCVVEQGFARCNCRLGFTGSYCERGESGDCVHAALLLYCHERVVYGTARD